MDLILVAVVVVVLLAILASSLRVVSEFERAVIFRLGKFARVREAGLTILIPLIDTMTKVDIRVATVDVPKQDIITKDNVTINVDAVAYFKVKNAKDAVLNIRNREYSTAMISQTVLRNILGQYNLDSLLAHMGDVSTAFKGEILKIADSWGMEVVSVDIKQVVLPESMKRSMAAEAEAERERRAKVISADGEFQAAQKLADAAKVMASEPLTYQLRYLQTLREVSSEKSSTIIFPLPIELLGLVSPKK